MFDQKAYQGTLELPMWERKTTALLSYQSAPGITGDDSKSSCKAVGYAVVIALQSSETLFLLSNQDAKLAHV
jgi:hypothetical protein